MTKMRTLKIKVPVGTDITNIMAETLDMTPDEQHLIDTATAYHEAKSGHSRLWGWFGLSRASFLVLPRVLMHEMPDEWQRKMAVLLEEYEQTWADGLPGGVTVSYKVGRYFRAFPEWVCNYRHPWSEFIDTLRRKV